MLSILLDVLLPIAVVAAIGVALRRSLALDLATMNRVMLYGLSPVLIFVSLASAEIGGDAGRMAVMALGVVATMALVTAAISLSLGLRGPSLSALLLSTLFMNSGNYGLPVARFAFGESGFTQAIVYFVVQSILAQTLGVGIAATGAARGLRVDKLAREVGERVLRMPQLYAVALALAARGLGLDLATMGGAAGGLFRGLVLLSEAALPLMLLLLGMQLGDRVSFEQPGLVALAAGLRLVVSPIVAFGLARLLHFDHAITAVAVLLSGMPTAVNTAIVALEFGSQPRLVVGAVVASSFASLATLSMLIWLLT